PMSLLLTNKIIMELTNFEEVLKELQVSTTALEEIQPMEPPY
ncbi:2763_t:CDS:1, partial [Funneliformis mosseae]